MRVHVEKDYYISADSMNYTLEQKTVTQNGKNAGQELYKQLGYHASIESCLKSILRLEIADSTATTIQELVSEIRAIRARLEERFAWIDLPMERKKSDVVD